MNLEELKKKSPAELILQAEKLDNRKSKHTKKTRNLICDIKKTCRKK